MVVAFVVSVTMIMPSSPRSDLEQMDEATQHRLQVVGDFKHGSIKRIKLINFLTYTAVEVLPKPRYVDGPLVTIISNYHDVIRTCYLMRPHPHHATVIVVSD